MVQNAYTFTEVPTICILHGFLQGEDELFDIKTITLGSVTPETLRSILDVHEEDYLIGDEIPISAKAAIWFKEEFGINLDLACDWFASFV